VFTLLDSFHPETRIFPSPSMGEDVKKFDSPMKSAFLVVQGTGKFAPAKSAGQE